ncbi:MAG: hypothetical protein U0K48_05755 [Bacilli bacterium]|jgi:predicted phage-related endonuclease|nr:hypothetical protein [Bacilli bacterium]
MNEMVVIKNNEIIVDATVIEKIKDFKKAKAQMDLVEKELNKSLKEAMEKVGLKKFIVNGLCATIKDGTTRTTVDSKRLKEEAPDIYEEYSKTTPVASSITLTFEE